MLRNRNRAPRTSRGRRTGLLELRDVPAVFIQNFCSPTGAV
jgi:hypothetical protein